MSINRHVFCQYCYVYFYLCWLLCWGYFVYSYYFSINTFYLQHDCGDSTMTAWPTAAQFRRSSVTSDVVGSKSSRSSGVSTSMLRLPNILFLSTIFRYLHYAIALKAFRQRRPCPGGKTGTGRRSGCGTWCTRTPWTGTTTRCWGGGTRWPGPGPRVFSTSATRRE